MGRGTTFLRRTAAAVVVAGALTVGGGVGGFVAVQEIGPSSATALAVLEDAAGVVGGLYVGQRLGRKAGGTIITVAAVSGVKGVLDDAGITVDVRAAARELRRQIRNGGNFEL